jgi:hypothetical protein
VERRGEGKLHVKASHASHSVSIFVDHRVRGVCGDVEEVDVVEACTAGPRSWRTLAKRSDRVLMPQSLEAHAMIPRAEPSR